MKTLFLNRHAKASWEHRDLDDFDRPLNTRGEHDAPMMGKRLAARNEEIELILSSPAKRAITTARIIAHEIGFPEEEIITLDPIYRAGVIELLQVVNSLDDRWNSVLLFGHNPGFTDFCDYLSGAGIMNIPTCGISKIKFETPHWKEISAHTGTVEFFDFPKLSLEI